MTPHTTTTSGGIAMGERPYSEEYLDAIALAAVVQALKRYLK